MVRAHALAVLVASELQPWSDGRACRCRNEKYLLFVGRLFQEFKSTNVISVETSAHQPCQSMPELSFTEKYYILFDGRRLTPSSVDSCTLTTNVEPATTSRNMPRCSAASGRTPRQCLLLQPWQSVGCSAPHRISIFLHGISIKNDQK